jgi:esterase/lipase superfamily enzyme
MMSIAAENANLLEALSARSPDLEELLGPEWPYYRELLISLEDRIAGAGSESEVAEIVDEVIEALSDSPAAELIRILLAESLKKPGEPLVITRGTGSISPRTPSTESAASPSPAAAAGRLAERLLPGTVEGYTVVPIFFATDRMREGDRYGRKRGELEFGTAAVSIPADHRIGEMERPKWWKLELEADPAKHVTILRLDVLDRNAFTNELISSIEASSDPSILLFVHGYNVTFDEAARRTAQLSSDLGFQGIPMLFSWPSVGKLLSYTVDEANSEWAQPHLQDVLALISTSVGAKSINIIAHSMGNRVLVHALRSLPAMPDAVFREIALAAPDVDAAVFRNLAKEFARHAERVTLYASSGDRALRASKRVHGYARAGESGQEILVLSELIDTIDASAVDTSLLGHSYYGDNRSILSDIFNLFKNRNPPPRFGMTRREIASGPYWVFRP